jgi:hypothetical protein
MAAPLATDRPLGRAPITAGIPADRTPGHEENR